MPSRDRSHSPRHIGDHRCIIGITTAQKEQVEATNMVLKEWFGNGQCVPVKDHLDAAVEYYQEAKGDIPDFLLVFYIPAHFYYMWIDNGSMIRVKHLCGYRIKSDLNLNELDTEWKVHPIHM